MHEVGLAAQVMHRTCSISFEHSRISSIVAFDLGVGVALSVVGDYMASAICVAISASLLPPAVNCGMLWAMSLYVFCFPELQNEHTASELGFMGTISIVLTIENIILVFLGLYFVFSDYRTSCLHLNVRICAQPRG